jgi:hypothetical protein
MGFRRHVSSTRCYQQQSMGGVKLANIATVPHRASSLLIFIIYKVFVH